MNREERINLRLLHDFKYVESLRYKMFGVFYREVKTID